jgi:hypothetical protein
MANRSPLKIAALISSYILLVAGFISTSWIFPLFTLNEPHLTWYIVKVLQIPIDKDPSAGAAVPFLWLFFTLPIGIIFGAIGSLLFYLGKKK